MSEDREAELLKDIDDIIEAHLKIKAAYTVGGRPPVGAIDTMIRLRKKYGHG